MGSRLGQHLRAHTNHLIESKLDNYLRIRRKGGGRDGTEGETNEAAAEDEPMPIKRNETNKN